MEGAEDHAHAAFPLYAPSFTLDVPASAHRPDENTPAYLDHVERAFDAVVQRMNAEVNRALAAPAVVEAFQKGGIASLSGTPAQFAAFIQSEIARYADVIRRANITAEG